MKKFFFLAAAAVCLAYNSQAKVLISESVVTKGECGYRYVLESHEGGLDALSCFKPGYCDCRFELPLTQTPKGEIPLEEANNAIGQMEQIIESAVKDGVTSGSFNSELGTVQWSQTDDGNLTIAID